MEIVILFSGWSLIWEDIKLHYGTLICQVKIWVVAFSDVQSKTKHLFFWSVLPFLEINHDRNKYISYSKISSSAC